MIGVIVLFFKNEDLGSHSVSPLLSKMVLASRDRRLLTGMAFTVFTEEF